MISHCGEIEGTPDGDWEARAVLYGGAARETIGISGQGPDPHGEGVTGECCMDVEVAPIKVSQRVGCFRYPLGQLGHWRVGPAPLKGRIIDGLAGGKNTQTDHRSLARGHLTPEEAQRCKPIHAGAQ